MGILSPRRTAATFNLFRIGFTHSQYLTEIKFGRGFVGVMVSTTGGCGRRRCCPLVEGGQLARGRIPGEEFAVEDQAVRQQGGLRIEETESSGWGLSPSSMKGISEDQITRIAAGRPYNSLQDFWERAHSASRSPSA